MARTPSPNILFLTWHDAGRWFGCYGSPVRTPNVDRLAAEGCRFSRSFSACAICSPSRAAIMTGRYCQDNGVMTLTNGPMANRIHPGVRHLSRRLREDHGYHTALFGVQHEAAHEHVGEIIHPCERFNTDPWPMAADTASSFEKWIAGRKDEPEPFFAQVGFFESHLGSYYTQNKDYDGSALEVQPAPAEDVPEWLEPTEAARQDIGRLSGLVERGDAAFGRMLDALDRHGLAENTVVVMCVDHGIGVPRAKTTCYDPGLSVGWLIRWPGQVKAGHTVEALNTHVDVLPTLFELLGLEVPAEAQGHSLAAHARGEATAEVRDHVMAHFVENIRAVRTHRYKLIRNLCDVNGRSYLGEAKPAQAARQPVGHLELYDLENDPGEFHDLSRDPAYAEVRDELDFRLWEFLLEHRDFTMFASVRDAWGAEFRQQQIAHCARAGRPVPDIDG